MTMLNPKEEAVLKLVEENRAQENYFFNKVTKIKWFYPLKERGYFNPNRAPGPKPAEEEGSYYIPQWNILFYLEDISKKVNIPENEKYIDELLEIIRNISNFKDSEGKHIDNYRTWWSFVKILANIPNEKIPEDIIDLIPIWLDSKFGTSLHGAEIINQLLPKFLDEESTEDNIKKAEIIIRYITEIKINPLSKEKKKLYGKREEFQFKLDFYWLKKAFEKHEKLIAEKCTVMVIKDFVEKIKKLLKEQTDGAYTSFYIDDHIFEPLDLLTKVLKNILNEKTKLVPNETREILKDFIKNDFYYFQKIALYIIGQNAKSLNDLVWENLDEILGNSVKRNYFVGDELKILLKNLPDLSEKQKEKIKSIVEKGPSEDIPDKNSIKYIHRWKQKIYQALSSDPYFKVLYESLKERTKEDAELTPGVVWLGMKAGKEESPLTVEEILKKSNKELAVFFKKFRSKDFWEGPTTDGLSDLLKGAVQQNPEKFSINLTPFLKSGYLYVYAILWGLLDAWKAKKNIDWKSLLAFIKDYVKQEGFWEGKLKVEGSHWDANHERIFRLVGELIQEGTKDDEWAFSAELLSDAELVLFYIIDEFLKNSPKEDQEEVHDPVTHALNSAAGNIITALVFLALRKARIEIAEKEEGAIKWSPEIKDKYVKLLERQINEAYTLLGQYMPNFMYLDKAWMRTKINEQEKKENSYWLNFMSGYLYRGKVYFDIFKMMMPHYIRAIKSEFKDKIAEERFIQHIAIGYLNDLVEINKESLIDKVIQKSNTKQMDTLVSYFRNQRRGLLDVEEKSKEKLDETTKVRNRVTNFWRHLYQKFKEKPDLSDDDREILSQLLDLTIFLPKLDEENYEWIIFSFSESKHKRFYEPVHLIEDLKALKEKGDQLEACRLVGKIFLEILKKSTPYIFKDNIKEIVVSLYKIEDKKAKEYADEICNIYAERGVCDEQTGRLFLRDVYKKHNQ